MSLLGWRTVAVVQSFVVFGFAIWTLRELAHNAFLRAYLEQAGWAIYVTVGIVVVSTFSGSCVVAAVFPWQRITFTLRQHGVRLYAESVEVRLTDKGQVFVPHDDDGTEAHAEPGHVAGHVALATSGQGALINNAAAPGGRSSEGLAAPSGTKGGTVDGSLSTVSPESITIPNESPLRAYVLKQEGNYRVVEPGPGEPAMQRLRGVVPRRKNTDDKRTNNSS
jgi:hypothetical protein